MKDGVGVVQFGTNDCTVEHFCYILTVRDEKSASIEGNTAYCVDMTLKSDLLVKGCFKNFYFFRKLYRGASNIDMCESG